MIYGSWFRNKMEPPIPGYERFAPYDKGEGLYVFSSGSPTAALCCAGEIIPYAQMDYSKLNATSFFGKKVKKITHAPNGGNNYPGRLSNIFLPNVEEIGDNVFAYGTKVQDIFLPKVKILGDSCFYALSIFGKPLSLPNVKSIGERCFNTMSSMPSILLPKVLTIPNNAFSFCSSLASISIPLAHSIGDLAFDDCKSLVTLDLPNVTSVNSYAFLSCDALTTIKMPKVRTLGQKCFMSCTSLKSIICKRGMKATIQANLAQSGITHPVTITEV